MLGSVKKQPSIGSALQVHLPHTPVMGDVAPSTC